MALRWVLYNGKWQLREMDRETWEGFKRAQDRKERQKANEENKKVNEMIIKKSQQAEVGREMIGETDYWVQPTGAVNAGRTQYAVHAPSGEHLTNVWGKEKAEQAIAEHIEKGSITHE